MYLKSSAFTVFVLLLIVAVSTLASDEKEKKKMNDPCYKPCRVKKGPVCGNNGQNYSTPCHLSVARCKARRQGQIIFKQHDGFCSSAKPLSPCQFTCNKLRRILCGSDGVSYRNFCQFKKAKCKKRKKKVTITIVKRIVKRGDKCPRSKSETTRLCRKKTECPQVYRQVCGTDNKTYKNICHLKTENCLLKKKASGKKAKKLTLKHCGPCGNHANSWRLKCPSLKLCDQLLKIIRLSKASRESKTKTTNGKGKTKKASPSSGKKKMPKKTKTGSKGKKPKKVTWKIPTRFKVCGSDGNTYASVCHFSAAQCLKRNNCQMLRMKRKGPCKKSKGQ